MELLHRMLHYLDTHYDSHTDKLFNRAEIIKIEHPTRGDDTRAWGPPYAPYSADSKKSGPGESAYFLGVSLSIILNQ